jgi:serine/threonine protein kinase/tetratricopeptide (TPR) repeat protein
MDNVSAPKLPFLTPSQLPKHASAWRAHWRRETNPDLGDFLRCAGQLTTAELAAVLLVDQEEHWSRADLVVAEEYLGRFPVLINDATHGLSLVHNEFLLRRRANLAPTVEEFAHRFPQFAAGLRRLLETNRPASPDQGPAAPNFLGYEILRELGRGSTGIVYLAREAAMARLVALKVFPAGAQATPEQRARFRTEAEAVARLQCPNVVQIFEIGDNHELPYLVQEYVPGLTLAQRLRGKPFPLRDAANLVEVLARALASAHQRDVVHGNLKPSNVLVAEVGFRKLEALGDQASHASTGQSAPVLTTLSVGTPKITDFRVDPKFKVAPNAQSETTAGTVSYLAPEQLADQGTELRSTVDVYALGVILYELLTGRPPFRGATLSDTVEQVRTAEPVPPRRLQPSVSPELDAITVKCLQKDPAQRYQSPQDLADDLRRFLDGEPIQVAPISVAIPAARPGRRGRGLAFVTCLLAAGVVGLLLGGAVLLVENATLTDGKQAAEDRAQLAYQSVDRLIDAITDGNVLQERDPFQLAVKMLDNSIPLLEKLAQQKPDDPSGKASQGRVYGALGVLFTNLGRHDPALVNFKKMEQIFLSLNASDPQAPDYRYYLAQAYRGIGLVLFKENATAKGQEAMDKSLDLFEGLAAENAKAVKYPRALASTYALLGALLRPTDESRAETCYRAALEPLKLLAKLDERAQGDLVAAYTDLGLLLVETGQPAAALKVLATGEAVLDQLPPNAGAADPRFLRAAHDNTFGLAYLQLGERAKAVAWFEKGLQIVAALEKDAPSSPFLASLSGQLHGNLVHLGAGQPGADKRIEYFNKWLANPDVPKELQANLHYGLAQALCQLGYYKDAIPEFAAAVGKQPEYSRPFFLMQLAVCLAQSGHHDGARKEAGLLASKGKQTAHTCFQLARVYALCFANPNNPPSLKQTDAAQALDWLVRARDAGWFSVTGNDEIFALHPDFHALLNDADFHKKLQQNKIPCPEKLP